ncbi:MAG: nucleotidyltransferase domain-containing protein [Syntrophomonadaceae bacterium]|nr:nucleotidyltransferase domain-containing protein [Syntrophomonadaceae bacterium]MDD4550205.1 nucleotidyltransferase domain-containing protein [Syntrophomonadaceae bacterium]
MLFGSQARKTAGTKSDIDLCISQDTDNKRALAVEINITIESERPLDIIVYTPDEWVNSTKDSGSFASLIAKKGVELYGR